MIVRKYTQPDRFLDHDGRGYLRVMRMVPDSNALKIGLAEEPRTLNVWLASDTNSRKVLSLIYQPLYVYDPDTLDLVPWLAESMPVYDPERLSYTVHLRPARWSDGTAFTSRDVAFTGNLIQNLNVPRFASNWRFILRIETPDDHTVVFYLEKPMAAFLSGTLATPIVQEEEWSVIAEKAKIYRKATGHLDQPPD
jgi:peptide/nickel transport system substrate-binding protein